MRRGEGEGGGREGEGAVGVSDCDKLDRFWCAAELLGCRVVLSESESECCVRGNTGCGVLRVHGACCDCDIGLH